MFLPSRRKRQTLTCGYRILPHNFSIQTHDHLYFTERLVDFKV